MVKPIEIRTFSNRKLSMMDVGEQLSHDSILLLSFCWDMFMKLQTMPLIIKKKKKNTT